MSFEMYPGDMIKFRRLMKRRAKKVGVATGMFLNEMAFRNRTEAIKILPSLMTVRTPGLLKRQLRVGKANLGAMPSQQEASFGSVHVPRTTGWKEQQLGLQDPREHRVTMHGRRGGIKRRAIASARLKTSRSFRHPKQYKGISKHNRAFNMIKQLSREGYREPFIVYGYTGMTSGVYRLQGRKKIKLLHSFKETNKKIKQVRWLQLSFKQMQKHFNRADVWKNILQRIK